MPYPELLMLAVGPTVLLRRTIPVMPPAARYRPCSRANLMRKPRMVM